MASSRKRYRRVSVTQEDGKPGKYDARVDMIVDPATGEVTWLIYSQVIEKVVRYRSQGNAAEDNEYVEEQCRLMYEFDQGFRVRAVPKPERSSVVAVMEDPRCEACGGDGWVEDETGYPMVCNCRGD